MYHCDANYNLEKVESEYKCGYWTNPLICDRHLQMKKTIIVSFGLKHLFNEKVIIYLKNKHQSFTIKANFLSEKDVNVESSVSERALVTDG